MLKVNFMLKVKKSMTSINQLTWIIKYWNMVEEHKSNLISGALLSAH
jgi:hypothetical protein